MGWEDSFRLRDENGVPYGIPNANKKPRVSSMPYGYDIAEGYISGHSSFMKIGYNADIGTAEEDLWTVGGVFVPPTAAMQMEVVSSSADDKSDGTGIRKVIIYYLDSSGLSQSEEVTLNGTTAVATVATDITFINGFRAVTTGTGLRAAGNIDIRHLDDTPIYSRIQAGYTRARNINYKVPADKNLYITSYVVGVYGATKGIRFAARTTYDGIAQATRDFFLPQAEITMTNGVFERFLELPTKVPAGNRLKISGVADQAGAVCSCAIRGWLEDV